MRFKDLTQEQKDHIINTYNQKDGESFEKRAISLSLTYDCSERTIRKWMSEKLGLKERIDIVPEVLEIAKTKIHDDGKKRFLITSAQSATPVNKSFLTNLEAYAEHIDAEILVIPFRYKNPTSVFTNKEENNDWWDPKIVKYLTLNRHDLNNGISVLSDVPIQPTATSPLNGLEGMTGEHSCVVGHPRMELKTIPVMEGCRPKIMFTTGACTKPNFTSSKVGKKGEFHFTTGFSIVEIKDDETFFFRQVSANANGEFIDLFYHVKKGIISKETEVEAIAFGDIHVANVDDRVINTTLDHLFPRLKPKAIFFHDIIDSESISHHNLKNPFKLHEQEMNGSNSLQKEINDMIDWLRPFKDYNVHIVKSNHDTHIDQFLQTTSLQKITTLKNAIPYMVYSLATLNGEAPNGIVPYVINKHYPKFKCLGIDDNVTVKGWLMSVHGHLGASGSRGSLPQYSRLSTKIMVGHSHTIGRIGGAISVGCSCKLRVGFNTSFNGWLNAHGIINRLGKAQLIVFFNTKDGMEYTTL